MPKVSKVFATEVILSVGTASVCTRNFIGVAALYRYMAGVDEFSEVQIIDAVAICKADIRKQLPFIIEAEAAIAAYIGDHPYRANQPGYMEMIKRLVEKYGAEHEVSPLNPTRFVRTED